jgi:hypothetical protein
MSATKPLAGSKVITVRWDDLERLLDDYHAKCKPIPTQLNATIYKVLNSVSNTPQGGCVPAEIVLLKYSIFQTNPIDWSQTLWGSISYANLTDPTCALYAPAALRNPATSARCHFLLPSRPSAKHKAT